MRKVQAAFIFFVLIIMSLPILRFNFSGTVSEKENRALVKVPSLRKNDKLNTDFFSDCSAYFNDRFGGREKLISLNKRVSYNVLGAAAFNDKAIRGKKGWLYYTGVMVQGRATKLSDFYKTNLLSKEQLSTFAENVRRTAQWCESNGIKVIFLICPNKHSVYPEYYPFQPRPEGQTRSEQLCSVFEELNLPYIFPLKDIIEKKSAFDFPLYWETDTHWNPVGANIAFERIFKIMRDYFPNTNFPKIKYDTVITYGEKEGDLLPILGLEHGHSTRPSLVPSGCKKEDFYTFLHYDFMTSVHTKGTDPSLPRAIIFHDSFFGALEPFVSPIFSEVQYKFKQFSEDEKSFIREYKPDVIIFEAIEWLADTICG